MKKQYTQPLVSINFPVANDVLTTSGMGELSDDIGQIRSLLPQ